MPIGRVTEASAPRRVTVADIKSKFLRPSLTSYFEVKIPWPGGANLGEKGGGFCPKWCTKWIKTSSAISDRIDLLCTEAVLPGSNLATFETNNDRTGVTERFAHRRIFDDRIDLTFNVDGGRYSPIKFFEEWIDYTTGASTSNENQLIDGNYFYRMQYPEKYMATGLTVRKFERDTRHYDIQSVPDPSDPSRAKDPLKPQDGKNNLTYKFVNAYPISISSMPVAYDSSSVLKCTVSFTYIRYYIENLSEENYNS